MRLQFFPIYVTLLFSVFITNPLLLYPVTGRQVGSACCDLLKNTMQFAIYFVYFSSLKTPSLLGSWKHSHKYKRKVKAFTFEGLPCLLEGVTKISTVYSFHKDCGVDNWRPL